MEMRKLKRKVVSVGAYIELRELKSCGSAAPVRLQINEEGFCFAAQGNEHRQQHPNTAGACGPFLWCAGKGTNAFKIPPHC